MNTVSYGLPYVGSKNLIAEQIIDLIPSCKNFYDLFGGGGAITHCAALSGKWDTVHYNDFDSQTVSYFQNALNGKWDTDKFYSRKEFHDLCDTNPFVNYVWSFQCKGKTYFVGKDKELLRTPEELTDELLRARIDRVKAVGRLPKESIVITNKSYDKVKVRHNSVIYVDPPYADTLGYKIGGIDYDAFYDFCEHSKSLVFISSYWLPSDRFIPVRCFVKNNAFTKSACVEKVFIPKCQFNLYVRKCE